MEKTGSGIAHDLRILAEAIDEAGNGRARALLFLEALRARGRDMVLINCEPVSKPQSELFEEPS